TDICCISVIYASNFVYERQSLWSQIAGFASSITLPWAILGDFNCCRSPADKAGGSLLHLSKLGELNNFVFNSAVTELAAIGHFYTWFNQRLDAPIHIRLDRVFINDAWLAAFPNSYYIVTDPDISDHCPLILQMDTFTSQRHRFLFKNYWCKIPAFWDDVINVFSLPTSGSPICDFYHKLKELKSVIKQRTWSSSNFLKEELERLAHSQSQIISSLQSDPLNNSLNMALKSINENLSNGKAKFVDWISQRSKAHWLRAGEDDLKFLYSNIHIRQNSNLIRGIEVNGTILSSNQDISSTFINHFQSLFNSTGSSLLSQLP
ncbi:uncharacterized protein LOC110111721, partial [Dendrobium catenatum]|uniref:uncharacterized protein LOC110111721 n=1 Tax=Dendrobium catenatum TaxID=906689 RepID=UPI0009F5C139